MIDYQDEYNRQIDEHNRKLERDFRINQWLIISSVICQIIAILAIIAGAISRSGGL